MSETLSGNDGLWGIWVYDGPKLNLWGQRDTQKEALECLRLLEQTGLRGHVGRVDF